MRRKRSAGRCRKNKDGHKMLNSMDYGNYFQILWNGVAEERKALFGSIDALWFTMHYDGNQEKVMGWMKKSKDILDKKYILVPIVLWGHWRLLIVYGFGDEADNCAMILLDSLQSLEQSIDAEIRRFIQSMCHASGKTLNVNMIKQISLLMPKVPQQSGGEECGWYVLTFSKLFIESAPLTFSVDDGYPYFMTKTWFQYEYVKSIEEGLKCGKGCSSADVDIDVEEGVLHDKVSSLEESIGILESHEEHVLNMKVERGQDPAENEEEDVMNQTEKENESGEEDDSDCSCFKDSDYDADSGDDDNVYLDCVNMGLEDFEKNVKLELRSRDKSKGKGKAVSGLHDVAMQENEKMVKGENRKQNEVPIQGHIKKGKLTGKRMSFLFRSEEDINIEGCLDVINEREDSDDENSDHMFIDSGESCSDDPNSKHVKFDTKRGMDNPKFALGMIFGTRDQLKCAIVNHVINLGRKIIFEKNDKKRVIATCKANNCDWKVVGRVLGDGITFQIRKILETHSCARSMDSCTAPARFIAKKYLEDFKSERGLNVAEFKEKVHRDLNINISSDKVYKTKKQAKILIEGKYKDQYKLLWDYCEELRMRNPCSSVALETHENEDTGEMQFKRIYVCLHALKVGFLSGCRKLIGLDGTFFKGPHPGILLTAVGVDPNNGIFLIAYAVVEGE